MPRIISWNTRGSYLSKLNAAYGVLLSDKKDNIIMIQEGGNVGQASGTQFPVTFGAGSRNHIFNSCFFDQPGSKNKKCTTGILVEDGFTINNQIFCYTPIGKRPIVTCECIYMRSRYVFATVHSTAEEILAEEELQDINLAFRNQYDRNNIPWIIMGDLNCQADTFSSDYPINVSYPNNMTHENGKTLDFAIYSDLLKGKINVKMCTNLKGILPNSSDHFPICCEF